MACRGVGNPFYNDHARQYTGAYRPGEGTVGFFGLTRTRNTHFDAERDAYRRLHGRGFRPEYIVDVGAHEGSWTAAAREIFGDVPTLMVEPQDADQPVLQALCARLPDTRVAHHVLSAHPGETVTFYQLVDGPSGGSSTGSSLKPERSDVPRREIAYVTETLDRVAEERDNIFLKIDAQGGELDILRGGEATLARCALVQLEVAVMRYNEGAPTMLEVLAFMDARGFAPIDISGQTRLQGHLVQVDLLFAPSGSPLRHDFFSFAAPGRA